jgi:23S rRNA (pseudouridine1915-N3)-methyltransferase
MEPVSTTLRSLSCLAGSLQATTAKAKTIASIFLFNKHLFIVQVRRLSIKSSKLKNLKVSNDLRFVKLGKAQFATSVSLSTIQHFNFYIFVTIHWDMKIQLWSVGKANETYVNDGITDFTKRINKYFSTDWLIIPPVKNAASLSPNELKKAEAQAIMAQLNKDDYLILLDERGKQLSSVELSSFIQQRANESNKRLIFLIGGAFGVNEIIMERANHKWSLSKLVFPHMLVRLILAEQVYRACTILKNEKYHHI